MREREREERERKRLYLTPPPNFHHTIFYRYQTIMYGLSFQTENKLNIPGSTKSAFQLHVEVVLGSSIFVMMAYPSQLLVPSQHTPRA